jgi:hypothetical protein
MAKDIDAGGSLQHLNKDVDLIILVRNLSFKD